MDLDRLAAMSEQEILDYLKEALAIQPPISPDVREASETKSRVKLGSGTAGKSMSRGQVASTLINRGASSQAQVLAVLANVAKAQGKEFNPDDYLKHIKK